MLRGQRIAVVVPAHNEQAHIARVLRAMPGYVDHVVVVDDGSRDGTGEVASGVEDPRVTIIRHRSKRGVGAALRAGYGRAFDDGAAVVAVMAGDGQMHPDDLEAVLSPVLSGQAGYAKGNRLAHPSVGTTMPTVRRWGNRVLSALTRVTTGLRVYDTQCGFTALGRGAHAQVPWARVWHGYGYPNDLLGWLSLAGVQVRDVTVRPIYGDEVSGVGFRHALCVIPGLLMRVLWRRLRTAGLTRSTRATRSLEPEG